MLAIVGWAVQGELPLTSPGPGLRAGDVVVAVDDENVSGSESLTAQVRERAPGDDVTLHVVRADALVQVEAVLGTRAGD